MQQFHTYLSQIDNRDGSPRDVPFPVPGVQIVGTAQKEVSRKLKKRGGQGWDESEGTLARHFNKASSSIPDYGIPYDWSILRALVIRGSLR